MFYKKQNIIILILLFTFLHLYFIYLCFCTLSDYSEVSNNVKQSYEVPQKFVQYESSLKIHPTFEIFRCPIVYAVLRIISNNTSSVIVSKLSHFIKLPPSSFIINCSVETNWLPKDLCQQLMIRENEAMSNKVSKHDIVEVAGIKVNYRRPNNMETYDEITIIWALTDILHCKDLDHKNLAHVYSTYSFIIQSQRLNQALGCVVTSWKLIGVSARPQSIQFLMDVAELLLQHSDDVSWNKHRKRSISLPKTPGILQDDIDNSLEYVPPSPRTTIIPKSLIPPQMSSFPDNNNKSPLQDYKDQYESIVNKNNVTDSDVWFVASTVDFSDSNQEDTLEPSMSTTALFKRTGSGFGSGSTVVHSGRTMTEDAHAIFKSPLSYVHHLHTLLVSSYRESFGSKTSPLFSETYHSGMPVSSLNSIRVPHTIFSVLDSTVHASSLAVAPSQAFQVPMASLPHQNGYSASSWLSSTFVLPTSSHVIATQDTTKESERFYSRLNTSTTEYKSSLTTASTQPHAKNIVHSAKPTTPLTKRGSTHFRPNTMQIQKKMIQQTDFSSTAFSTQRETSQQSGYRVVDVLATQGKLFSVDVPEHWHTFLQLGKSAVVYFTSSSNCVSYNKSTKTVFGIWLGAVPKTVMVNVTLKTAESVPWPSAFRVVVSFASNSVLEKPKYVVLMTCSIESVSLLNAACGNSSSYVEPAATLINKLIGFLPHLAEDDLTVGYCNITCNSTATQHRGTMQIRWFIDKFDYQLFAKHYYPLLVQSGESHGTKEFFFALFPEFIMKNIRIEEMTGQSVKEVSNPTQTTLAVSAILPVCVVVVFVLILCIVMLVKYRRKKAFGKKIMWKDRTFATSRKPLFLVNELEMDRFRPSKPRILPDESRNEVDALPTCHETSFRRNASVAKKVQERSDHTSTSCHHPSLSTRAKAVGGTYSFVKAQFLPHDDCSSTCSDTSASSFCYSNSITAPRTEVDQQKYEC